MRELMPIFGLFVTTMGCNLPDLRLHPYAEYLNDSVGHADHDAVAKKMGAPNRIVAIDKGGDRWTYKFCRLGTIDSSKTASTTGTVTRPHGYCQDLNLVFDNSGKLTEWRDTREQIKRP